MCGLVVVAPWLCGAVTARPQFFLAVGLVAIALIRFVQRLFQSSGPGAAGIPTVMIVAVGWIAIGVWQLSPSGIQNPLIHLKSATFADFLPRLLASPDLSGFALGLHTLSPDSTRLMLAQMGLALLAFWLSFEIFEDVDGRRWLYWALAINGLAMSGFGIAQQLTWNGKLFWAITLRDGGSPFGPFVNRNNGAGYLLLTFACAFASLIAAWFPFGMGQVSTRAEPSRSRLSGWLLRLLGHLTPGVMFSFLAIAAIAIGILASLSRAGAVAMVACMFILIPALNRWKTGVVVLLVAFAGLAYGGILWVGKDDKISHRLETLKDLSVALKGRIDHWQEVEPLIKDFPRTGTGLGTYQLVNPVYLSRNQGAWYQHAENQYLETLAEAGFPGLALFVIGLLLIVYASARSIRSDQEGRQLASGLCGLLSVTAMLTISLTDFSLSIGSIVLTFCVITGAVYAPFSKSRRVSIFILFANQRPVWRLLVGPVLLLTSGLAFYQIHSVAEVEVVVDAIPRPADLPTLETPECDEILSQLNTLGVRYPLQPEIFAAAGELRVYRYRRMMYDDILSQSHTQTDPERRKIWALTHLERLDAALNRLRAGGDPDSALRLLESGEIRQNLPKALADFNRCLLLNPLQRGLSMPRVWVSHILGEPAAPSARDFAMFVGASDPDILFQLGQLSEHRGDAAETSRCWKRCLEISDKWATVIWDQATLTRDESETYSLYPQRLDCLLAIVSLPRDLQIKREILASCNAIVAADPTISPVLIARLSVELQDLPRAADAYLAAIRLAPRDIVLRLEASEILEKAGRVKEAREVVGFALALAPGHRQVKKRFEDLISAERASSKSAQDRENSLDYPKNR